VDAALEATRELDRTGDLGEQRVIAATPDVLTGVKVRATLTNDDRSGQHLLASEPLHAKAPGENDRS
jgi:hypothetical protein